MSDPAFWKGHDAAIRRSDNPRLRCFWCYAPIDGDDRSLRRDLPYGSPCPHCGKVPLILEPIPEAER